MVNRQCEFKTIQKEHNSAGRGVYVVSTYPPLCEMSVLSPDRPELMDSSVGDCLSAMLQEDMLIGRDRL